MLTSYENFLEATARLVSMLLTNQETESVVRGFRDFHGKLKQFSSENLRSLALESAKSKHKPVCNHHGKTCSQNCIRGFLKAFAVGYVVKYGLAVAPALLTGKITKRPELLRRHLGRDTISFALFLSTFTSSYKGILCALRHHRRNRRPHSNENFAGGDRLNAFIAGSLAGMCLRLDRNRTRRTAVALYLLVRALQYGSAWLLNWWTKARQRRRHRRLLRERLRGGHAGDEFDDDFEIGLLQRASPASTSMISISSALSRDKVVAHRKQELRRVTIGDRAEAFLCRWAGTGVMMISSAQILYAFILMPDALPAAYLEFLYTQSGLRVFGPLTVPLARTIGAVAHELSENPRSSLTEIPEGVMSRDFIRKTISPNLASLWPESVRHDYVLCAMFHPSFARCEHAHAVGWVRSFGRSMWLYVPLNLAMFIIFKGSLIVKCPPQALASYIKATLQSSVFLSTYVTIAWLIPCWLRRLLRREKRWFYFVNGIFAGLSVLIEPPKKRLELGLYCLPRALESAWKCGVEWGWLRNVSGGELLYSSLSMGVLMSLYQTDPDIIDDSYRALMVRMFGAN